MAKNTLSDKESFYPKNRGEWRQWLQKYHLQKQSVQLILYKKESGKPTLTWSEAVDEALCFGWIDSTRRVLDHEKFTQSFGKRKSRGTWSKINKEKIERLLAEGLVAEAGLKSIETAKQNGSWNILDTVEELEIPKDLLEAFRAHPGSRKFFMSLSRSVKKQMLHWVVMAKRPETRHKRILEIASRAAQHLKPAHIV